MLSLPKTITLFLVFAWLLAAADYEEYASMTDELKERFRQYLKENQPFIIEDKSLLNLLPPGTIYWPDEDKQVFLGKDFKKNPVLKQFQKPKGWVQLYMDDEMRKDLKFYEKQLKLVEPWHKWKWLRWGLADAMQPERRQGKPASTVVKDVINDLIANAGEQSAERIRIVRSNIGPAFDRRYGEGSFDA